MEPIQAASATFKWELAHYVRAVLKPMTDHKAIRGTFGGRLMGLKPFLIGRWVLQGAALRGGDDAEGLDRMSVADYCRAKFYLGLYGAHTIVPATVL